MRIAITGATGNVARLSWGAGGRPAGHEIVGVARRRPGDGDFMPLARLVQADIARDDLVEPFTGADAVVHLAWEIPAVP